MHIDFQRTAFRQAITEAMEACAPDTSLAVVTIKLHDLHKHNQVQGYDRVDQEIRAVMDSLGQSLNRATHICRLSSAIIGLIFQDLKYPHLVRVGLDRIRETLAEPFGTSEEPIHLRVSASASLFPQDADSADALLLAAEKALRSTRPLVRPLLLFEDVEIEDHEGSYLLESDLKGALSAKQLSVNYQPKVWLADGSCAGFEALVRWQHPTRGPLSPEIFVPIAESMGMMDEMTESIMQTAVREVVSAGGNKHSKVSVNVSATTLFDPCFPFVVDSATSLWNADYGVLTLEITETTLMENFDAARSLLNQLRDKGIAVSIDDFGTGYSSLAYFKHLPADEIKIDQSFVTNMVSDTNDQRLVEAIIDLAHKFNLSVVAEGVEDVATYDMLRDMGCDVAQGYYISKAIGPECLPAWYGNARLPAQAL